MHFSFWLLPTVPDPSLMNVKFVSVNG